MFYYRTRRMTEEQFSDFKRRVLKKAIAKEIYKASLGRIQKKHRLILADILLNNLEAKAYPSDLSIQRYVEIMMSKYDWILHDKVRDRLPK